MDNIQNWKDAVMADAKTYRYGIAGTSSGLKMLELSDDPSHYLAANTYLESLRIINELLDKLQMTIHHKERP